MFIKHFFVYYLSSTLFTFVRTNSYDDESKKVRTSSTTRTMLTITSTSREHKTVEKKNYDAEYIDSNGNKEDLPGSYQVFYSKTLDWCNALPDNTRVPNDSNGWVALIEDDEEKNCTCADKLRTAKHYNASAAIVLFSYCGIREKTRSVLPLTAVTVSRDYALDIIKTYETSVKVMCEISKRARKRDKQFRVSKTSVLFVLVSFILLMCISLAWLVFYYVQRFRHIYRNDRKERQLLNAAKKAISKLKTAPFSSSFDGEDCAICLGTYKDGETVRILPCKHVFHKTCIDPWLLNHRTCPLCKNNILKSLGVEIPENINLTHYDVDNARVSTRGDVEVGNSTTPSNAEDTQSTTNAPVEALLPSASSVFVTTTTSTGTNGGASSSNTTSWGEGVHHHTVSASVCSSTSSMLSDTDSERSTVALVSVGQKV